MCFQCLILSLQYSQMFWPLFKINPCTSNGYKELYLLKGTKCSHLDEEKIANSWMGFNDNLKRKSPMKNNAV